MTLGPLTLAGPNPDRFPGAAPAAADVQHRQRLQALCAGVDRAAPAERRRGSAWQQPRRRLEEQVRQEGAAFRHWVAAYGLNRIDSAACLGIATRTLRDWEQRLRETTAAAPRGRPVLRSERAARSAVLEFLESVGPGVGRAVLLGQFLELPRAELTDLLKRYRGVWRRRHPQLPHVLHWQRPGTVWAIDYARPPLPLEEGYTDLRAVRDLASGMQLLWLPVAEATAATTTAALLSLFLLYGAPLVLKLDNGSPFVAQVTQELLTQWQVLPLYSPPGRPQYNGAIEAGIGALKVRTHHQAVRQGRPGQWTLAEAEAARQEANTLGRPWGGQGPTPAQRWAGHQVVTVPERQAFAASVTCLEHEAACASPAPAAVELAAAPEETPKIASAGHPTVTDADRQTELPTQRTQATSSSPPAVPTGTERAGATLAGAAPDEAARRRQAIRRALVAHGYLLFTRRRIPPPIRREKVT